LIGKRHFNRKIQQRLLTIATSSMVSFLFFEGNPRPQCWLGLSRRRPSINSATRRSPREVLEPSESRLTFVPGGSRNLREALDGGVPLLGGRVAAQHEHHALRVPPADRGVDVIPREPHRLGERRRVKQLHHVAVPLAVAVGPGHHGLDPLPPPGPVGPAAGRRRLRAQQQRAVLGRQRAARRVHQRALAVGPEPRDQHGRRRRRRGVLLGAPAAVAVAVLVVGDEVRERLADLPAEGCHGILPAEARRDNERQRPGGRRRGDLEEEGQPRHAHPGGATASGEGAFCNSKVSRRPMIDGSCIDTAITVGSRARRRWLLGRFGRGFARIKFAI
jgi:hypothetical protein